MKERIPAPCYFRAVAVGVLQVVIRDGALFPELPLPHNYASGERTPRGRTPTMWLRIGRKVLDVVSES